MKLSTQGAVLSLLLAGCAAGVHSPLTHKISATFDASAARALLVEGKNFIKGNAFMRQQGGGIVTCAGQFVYLVPATQYATERVRAIYGSDERGAVSGLLRIQFDPEVSAYRELVKTSRCDSQGNFSFEGVADGSFYLNTLVSWQVGGVAQGGQLMQRVQVSGGRAVSVVVAP
jgi:hypothetical protein